MGVFNKFAAPDVDEEKARMKALVEIFKDNNKDENAKRKFERRRKATKRRMKK